MERFDREKELINLENKIVLTFDEIQKNKDLGNKTDHLFSYADELIFEIKFIMRMIRLSEDEKYITSLLDKMPNLKGFYKKIDDIENDYAHIMSKTSLKTPAKNSLV